MVRFLIVAQQELSERESNERPVSTKAAAVTAAERRIEIQPAEDEDGNLKN
jgi:hypothetical protein